MDMPNILIKVPKDVFPAEARKALLKRVNEVAGGIENMPNNPKQRFLNWALLEEIESGMFTCGGLDVTSQVVPCIAIIFVPQGVLDNVLRTRYVAELHAAFQASIPADDKRVLATSIILNDVADGTWGANGNLWQLGDFAKAAGYGHLQHLIGVAQ
jgi:phenylpyruvate tautomerase PptA (4-oxalocrotonate tautomerase family)